MPTTPPAPTASDTAPPPSRPIRTSIVGLLRDARRLDRTQSDPIVSLRNAVGVAAPLAVGVLLGNAAIGLPATIGALQTAFADRPGPYRLRILRMLGTALAAAVTTTLALLASRSDAAAVALLLVLAFGAGLLLSAGPSATQVGTAGVAAALVLGHLPTASSAALHVGLLVFAGGVVQTVLAVAAWPLARHRPERRQLAALYRQLAAAARVPAGQTAAPPASDTLTATRQVLFGLGHDHGSSVEAYRVLLDEGERIRRETLIIDTAADRLAADQPVLAGLVRQALTAAGDVLDEIAEALDRPRGVQDEVLDRARRTMRFAVDRLEAGDHPAGRLTRLAAAARLRALSGQLRAAVESTRTGASEGRQDLPRPGATSWGESLRESLAVLRANLTPSSAVLRHATRVALLVAASDLVVRLAGIDRGYWVSLTVLVVLRPDFGTTLQRSVLRTVGTVVGLLVASELVHWVPGGQWWDVALIAVFAFGMRFAGPGNVGLSAVSLSALVVILLAINGVAPHATLVDRSLATLATLVGGVLAVLASVVFPAWERDVVPQRMADVLQAYLTYLTAVADVGTAPAPLGPLRTAARVARTNAQASVDRAAAEPVPATATIELGRTVLAHTHRVVNATLTIEALRPAVREGGGLPELAAFFAGATESMAVARDAIRSSASPTGTPKLRPLQDDLVTALDEYPDRVGGAEVATTLVDATDRMTNSLDTLLGRLRRQPSSS